MTGKLVYPALLLLFFAVSINTSYSVLALSLFFSAWIRIVLLKNPRMIFFSVLLCGMLFIRLIPMSSNDAAMFFDKTEQVILSVKETSYKVDGDKVTFEGSIKGSDRKVVVNYYIKSEAEKKSLENAPPKTVIATGFFSEPNEPANFNQFDYKLYLKNNNITSVFNASSLDRLTMDTNTVRSPYRLDSFRQKIVSYIDRTMTGPVSSYTKILLFADKRSLSHDVIESYKELGIIHLLSISGLHIVFIIHLFTHICRMMRISKESTGVLLLFCLPVYGITTGLPVSVFRAIGQTWIKVMGTKMNIALTSLDCWSLVLITTLFIRPLSVNTVGFQLSYLISFAIIMISHQPYFTKRSAVNRYTMLNILLLIISLPVLTFHFYEFSWGVLVLNGLFIPVMALVILPLIIANFFISLLFSGSLLFAYSLLLCNTLIALMEKSVDRIASIVSFTVITGRLSPVAYIYMGGFTILLLLLIEKNRPQRGIFIPLAGILVCLMSVRYSPYGQILMIDVNQGEAILIKEPWGKGNYLIDTGGQSQFYVEEWKKREKAFSIGKNIVVPVLKSEGVHQLESIIITHPDIDHFGALTDVLRDIKTKQVVSTKSALTQVEFQSLFPSIEKYGTIIKEVQEGANDDLPSSTVAIRSTESISAMSKNNSSLVMLGSIGNKTWLFTGDLEAEGEEDLLAVYPNLSVDVLKVGHHGSKTSTSETFLNQLDPEVAWISAGKNNRYGHPHDSIIEKITDAGTLIFRTDLDGAVRYRYSNSPLIERWDKRVFSFQSIREQRGE